jgi:hypothetical protein
MPGTITPKWVAQNEPKYPISLKNLKYNDDGKIIDHIFDYKSLLVAISE